MVDIPGALTDAFGCCQFTSAVTSAVGIGSGRVGSSRLVSSRPVPSWRTRLEGPSVSGPTGLPSCRYGGGGELGSLVRFGVAAPAGAAVPRGFSRDGMTWACTPTGRPGRARGEGSAGPARRGAARRDGPRGRPGRRPGPGRWGPDEAPAPSRRSHGALATVPSREDVSCGGFPPGGLPRGDAGRRTAHVGRSGLDGGGSSRVQSDELQFGAHLIQS